MSDQDAAIGRFLHNLLGGTGDLPGPPYTHTIAPPKVFYTRDGRVLYREPARHYTVEER